MFTVGSLFDGSGGFPLAAFMCGGVPVWASEIEPYPIAVTKSRFPYVKHLGSVTDIKGNEIDPVDVITFGSPCQDLSVAGLRKGLKHEDNGDDETTRSGLFMEAVRIIKEMREATGGKYPRFALWENVPGAFSSNKGEDFRVVCEELIKIIEPSAVMPPVPKAGWSYADHYCGDGWSLAYRVLDAQYWGVPQRRRRIYLVLDLGGERAGEILFKRDSLRGYFEEGRTPWQGVTGNATDSVGTADCEGECLAYSLDPLSSNSMKSKNPYSGCHQTEVARTIDTTDPNPSKNQGGIAILQPVICLDDQGGSQISVRDDGKSPTLRAEMHGNIPCVMEAAGFKENNSAKAYSDGYEHEVAPCLSANKHDASVCVKCYDARGNGDGNIVPTITGDHNNRITDYTCVCCEPIYCIDGDKIGKAERSGGSGLGIREGDKMYTLTAKDAGTHGVVYAVDQGGGKSSANVTQDLSPTLTCTHGGEPAVAFQTYQKVTGPLMANSHPGSYTGQDAYNDMLVAGAEESPIALDRAFYNQGQNALYDPQLYTDGTCPTIVARGPAAVCVRYIVRRLTPTECARLQGFPDDWGHLDKKTEFTDEEYEFWLNVRNTHAEINGKATKDYTREQMLTWYNKLHTDSSEYKMWGNGIALPNALYVMQGITEVFGCKDGAYL